MRIIALGMVMLLPCVAQAQPRHQVVPAGDVVTIAPRGAPAQIEVTVTAASPGGGRIGAAPPGWVEPARPLSFGRSFSGFLGEADSLGSAAMQAAPTLGLAGVAALTTLFGGRPGGSSGGGASKPGTATTSTSGGIAARTSTR